MVIIFAIVIINRSINISISSEHYSKWDSRQISLINRSIHISTSSEHSTSKQIQDTYQVGIYVVND